MAMNLMFNTMTAPRKVSYLSLNLKLKRVMEGMLKPGSLKDKTIIITGGGTGLGKSMGKYLLELGANLVITSRKSEVLEKTASELESQTGGKVLPVTCDVRKYEEIENVLRMAEKTFGQIHGVLNNAAGNFISP